MSDAMRATPLPERKTEPFRAWELPAREPGPAGKRTPDGCEEADGLAAVAVLSTN
ncbi:hypothetical protein [Aromatoleum evansii]|uniref:hypothetical protein n=1 Tax=Aromatoleum evansii TaxID=59406 RepID=UPI00145EA5E4|nr:hypothetical protein [Aromatoleum evansii]NMG30047.1 hypothetical protein [Aromatoleum evansii]